MGRKLREINREKAEVYHVVTRANRKNSIFNKRKNIELYMNILTAAKAKYEFILQGFSIMRTHVHLTIKPNLKFGNIHEIMRYLNGEYSKEYNRINDLEGSHTWRERYSSVIVKDSEHYVNVFKYQLSNPLEAGHVNHPLDWEFHSGHALVAYQKQKDGEEVDTDAIPYYDLIDFGQIGDAVIKKIVEFLETLSSSIAKGKKIIKERLGRFKMKIPKLGKYLRAKKLRDYLRYFHDEELVKRRKDRLNGPPDFLI